MTRGEFEKYIEVQSIDPNKKNDYWILYDKIYEPLSPLTYNQKANLLLSELRKIK
tara:strand:+ start:560 stop:724 length:165 start_codon:yes stop_codon:yes gene_type:complete